MELTLNEAQTKASFNIVKFLDNPKMHNFLLLGPAGSGKTTAIVNAFHARSYRIAFCAFTNKATQVLCKIADKFAIDFHADFMTIHVLLRLEVKYLDRETEIAFTFDKSKLEHLKNYDAIIFDECSTISKELYKYICEAHEYIAFTHDINLKYIFLGDFWQLPPIGEDKSVIFSTAMENKWAISKLERVMRCSNETMFAINENMLSWIPKFKSGEVSTFIRDYPYNLISKKLGHYVSLLNLLEQYMKTWTTETSDCIILTYSNSNCNKTNQSIQDMVDHAAGREIPEKRERLTFYVGDRCCIDRPITLYSIVKKNDITKLDAPLGVSLYNGEIFNIVDVEEVEISTPLNKLKYISKTFKGQRLTITRINAPTTRYEILHIPEQTINEARILIKNNERRMFYLQLLSDFIKKYPKLDYGYCMTIYKSQGSEFHSVFINLNSIKWSIIGSSMSANIQKKLGLFRTTYTAASRATDKLYCLWSK
jgi:hypothetical protein